MTSDENVDYETSNRIIHFKVTIYFVILDKLKNEFEKEK